MTRIQKTRTLVGTLVLMAWSSVAISGEIHDAAEAGNMANVKALLGQDPSLANNDEGGLSPLFIAAWRGHGELTKLLLTKNANVQARDMQEATPLHYAVSAGSKEVAELLLAKKADVKAKTVAGETPLHWAALTVHIDMVELLQLLLAHKADINAKDEKGRTPLATALDWQRRCEQEKMAIHGADKENALRHVAQSINYLRQHGAKE